MTASNDTPEKGKEATDSNSTTFERRETALGRFGTTVETNIYDDAELKLSSTPWAVEGSMELTITVGGITVHLGLDIDEAEALAEELTRAVADTDRLRSEYNGDEFEYRSGVWEWLGPEVSLDDK